MLGTSESASVSKPYLGTNKPVFETEPDEPCPASVKFVTLLNLKVISNYLYNI